MKMTKMILVAAALVLPVSVASADAEAVYSKNCASCHGKDGSADTKMGKKSGARDYRDAKVQASFTDKEAYDAIMNGVKKDGKTKMKGYSSKVSEAEAKELVKYIRAFKK
jgi:mono/diheme cytochrome c family protein